MFLLREDNLKEYYYLICLWIGFDLLCYDVYTYYLFIWALTIVEATMLLISWAQPMFEEYFSSKRDKNES